MTKDAKSYDIYNLGIQFSADTFITSFDIYGKLNTSFQLFMIKAPVRHQFTEEIVMPPVCDTMAYPVPSAGPTSVSTGGLSAAGNPSGLGHPSSLFGPATSLGSTAHRLGEHLAFGGGSIPPSTTTSARYVLT